MVNIHEFNNQGVVNINQAMEQIAANKEAYIEDKTLLQVVGELTFGQKDLLSLRRTGFSVTKLDVSELNDLELQIDRMRSQRQFIKYWHLSAHSSKSFIYLNNIPISPDWLIERINYGEIDILFLDTCESVYFSDKLLGTAKKVFSLLHKIYESDGEMITYYFWREIYRGASPNEAVREVKLLMPKIAHYLWMN